MTSLLHALHIGTLATWLSVAGFGTVAVILPGRPGPAAAPQMAATQWITQDVSLGEESSPAAPQTLPASAAAEPPATMPEPPAMPELTAREPLPEVPQAPAAGASIVEPPPAGPRPSARAEVKARAAGHKAPGKPSAAAATSAASPGGDALSKAARLAAGRMPPPAYPPEARRLGQTGSLVVDFTVDASGRVIAASSNSPSPWPLLNQEAIRTVRRWKFPPGAVMRLQRPIVFQLR